MEAIRYEGCFKESEENKDEKKIVKDTGPIGRHRKAATTLGKDVSGFITQKRSRSRDKRT